MIKFYYHFAPNPMKVALFLEESGLGYDPVPVDTLKGEQFSPSFLSINPNAKTPAIVDGEAVVFDSNAILLYLAEKTGKFLPENTPVARAELYSWLMFVATGIGPYSGQSGHFRSVAPEKIPYAIDRYTYEAERHWQILDARLEVNRYMLGSTYTIVDMAVWGWAGPLPLVVSESALQKLVNVRRLVDEINARPAAIRAEALKTKHNFKAHIDDEARRHLFRHVRKN